MIYVFTFQSLVKVAHARVSEDGLAGVTELGDPPSGVITRGMLKWSNCTFLVKINITSTKGLEVFQASNSLSKIRTWRVNPVNGNCVTKFHPFWSWKGNYSRTAGNTTINPYPTAFPYGNGMVLHFYQQQESSTTKTVHRVINKGLKTYV